MANYKYLLSTGYTTSDVCSYIIDLFRIALTVYPKDIPHAPEIGFDFNLSGVFKDELKSELQKRLSDLVSRISERTSNGNIQIESLELISETEACLTLRVNNIKSEGLYFNIYGGV